ncbi:MAG TPA: SRPBCC family protein [Polyangiaceae bacterium]|nr:SRPBCC family protein [Polyangiaceae bacterium]
MALKIVAGLGLVLAVLLVNDFHEWPVWSPYEKLDPAMKKTFEGPRSGAGSVYAYSGNEKAGQGRITIEKSVPGSLVALKLEFQKPFVATNEGSFTFTREGNATNVTWAMEGKNNFLFKAFSLVMNMDKLVGSEFEKGLAAMKIAAEKASKEGTSVASAVN